MKNWQWMKQVFHLSPLFKEGEGGNLFDIWPRKWVLIQGRALIRAWALIKGNTVCEKDKRVDTFCATTVFN